MYTIVILNPLKAFPSLEHFGVSIPVTPVQEDTSIKVCLIDS